MRELKFRAWNKKGRCWITFGGVNYGYEDGILDIVDSDNLIYEQYTGIEDRNGKEIYEGDVVKIEAYSRVFQVVYRKWDCSFIYENDEDEEIVHMFNGFPHAYEVIGNIHENPELLGGKE